MPITRLLNRFVGYLEKSPTKSFIGVLILLFSLIALASWFRSPAPEMTPTATLPKQSRVFVVGKDNGELILSAQVRKSGVVDIVALAPGIVDQVFVRPGQTVGRGTTLLALSNDYGNNTLGLVREKTLNEVAFTEKTFGLEKEIKALGVMTQNRIVKRNWLSKI
jgi:multidrug efflux pump subunit AcrA (membrane-fusion protein)